MSKVKIKNEEADKILKEWRKDKGNLLYELKNGSIIFKKDVIMPKQIWTEEQAKDLDKRFDNQSKDLKAYTDSKFDDMKNYTDKRFDDMKNYTDKRFDDMKNYTDKKIDDTKVELIGYITEVLNEVKKMSSKLDDHINNSH